MKSPQRYRAWDNRDKKMIATGFHVIGETTMFQAIEQYCTQTLAEGQTVLERLGDIECDLSLGINDKKGVEMYENDIFTYTAHPGYLLESFIAEIRWVEEFVGFGYLKLNRGPDGWEQPEIHPFTEHDEFSIDVLPHIEVVSNTHLLNDNHPNIEL